MIRPTPRQPGQVRPYRGLLGNWWLLVPALVFGAWRAAGAQHGTEDVGTGDVTLFFLALAAILVAAKVGGELIERLNQPAVLGELVVGIILGNLALAGIGVFEPLQTAPFLPIAAEIGVVLLLFQVGLESELDELLAVGASAVAVAVLGVIAPVALGYALSSVFLPGGAAWYVHLFLGATLAATSVGLTARVLKDIGRLDAPESNLILGAAVVDDILGLIVLAIVLGLVHAADAGGAIEVSVGPVLLIVLKAAGFLGGSVIVGRLLFVPLMRLVRLARSPSVPVVLAVAYCFLMAALAELVGLADIVGAFTVGLVVNDEIGRFFGEKKELYRIDASITPVSTIFVPVFFVYMGLRVDLAAFASLEVIVFAVLLSIVAIASKQVCALGVFKRGLNRWVVGIGMIPRGEVGLIFASIGHTVLVAGTPVLGDATFSAIIAMVMLTTLVTPPLLKAAFSKSSGSQARIEAGRGG
ncbi:MAG: cation:proton antiporter [Acidobacteria bacterium]|nr:cation:proton antiporter [Acidobacteriota bacterium]